MADLPAVTLGPARRRGARSVPPDIERAPLGVASGTGLGLAVLWLSLLVLVPLAAVVSRAVGAGPGTSGPRSVPARRSRRSG